MRCPCDVIVQKDMDEVCATLDAFAVRFLEKCVHIILTARLSNPLVDHNAEVGKWFNFPVGEVENAKETLKQWSRTPHAPLFVKIFCQEMNAIAEDRKLLETWKLKYSEIHSSVSRPSNSYRDDASAVYKSMIVLTRSLYSYVRLLPAYELIKGCEKEEDRPLDVQFEITLADSGDESWKEIASMQTAEGQLTIHVALQDIQDFPRPTAKGLDSASRLTDDWVHFVPKDTDKVSRFHNPVTEHLKSSYESMKSAVTAIASNRALKKAFSFPRSRQTSQAAMSSSEESRIYEFLHLLKSQPCELWVDADPDVDIPYGQRLLSFRQQSAHDACSSIRE